MKWAIVIPDGCADFPVESLGGKTPLQAARIPAMDEVASLGVVARTDNVPLKFPAGSEVANMTLFGYDPHVYFTGRAPIEAAAQGIVLGPNDWAVRCNLVTVIDQIMVDFTADHISTAEAKELLSLLQTTVDEKTWQFVTGVSYRNLLIYRNSGGTVPFAAETTSRAPHDITDQSVADEFPRGPGSDQLVELMNRSSQLFADSAVNSKRLAAGKKAATNVWLWGQGKAPSLPSFHERFGCSGAMITAVDLLRGIAALIGWDRIEVPGATGYLDTDYAGKGKYAIDALNRYDVVTVHIEATDEASHEGRVDEKVKALEQIDTKIVAPLHAALKTHGDYRLLILPDHPTPVSTKKHSHGFVPLTVCGKGIAPDQSRTYDEISAANSTVEFREGWKMMEQFMRGNF